jgi:UDP-GlcNAc:undecaprenyl-phosphate GlcNAc-1-phosphate transferase
MITQIILLVISFLIGGFILAAVSNLILLRFSTSLGIRNKNDVTIRWSNESKPSLGGVSFFVVFIFASFAHLIIFYDENIFHNDYYHLEFTGLFLAGSIAFLMGLADDSYNTRPLIKLVVQIMCGVIFVMTGTLISIFSNHTFNVIFTILWVIVIMNSLNMLDNMDGITGTTVFFILLSCLFGYWLIHGVNSDIWSLTIISVIGAVLGFLKYNIHPSKLFMGDAGSQFIGLFVAFFGVKCLWNASIVSGSATWVGFIFILVAFTPAAADTLTVVINRLKKGKSPMVGGKDHTTHHLVYAGYNDKQVWYVFLTIGFFATVLTILSFLFLINNIIFPIFFFVFYFVVVFFFLYRNTIKYPQKK